MSAASNGSSPPHKGRSPPKGLFPDMMAKKAANGSPPQKGKARWAIRGKAGVTKLTSFRSREDGRGGMEEGLVEEEEEEEGEEKEEAEGKGKTNFSTSSAQAAGEKENL